MKEGSALSVTVLCVGKLRERFYADAAQEYLKRLSRLMPTEVVELPETMECFDPLVVSVPLQLLAYHIAVCKGKNVDQPRNLAKSVTVE